MFAASSTTDDDSPSLLYLHDDCSGLDFLVDTGASKSLFPHQSAVPASSWRLKQADGSALPSWGRQHFVLQFGGRRFSFRFLLAAVDRPILGIDFLHKNGWLVDVPGRQILDSTTLTPIFTVPPPTDPAENLSVSFVDAPAAIQRLLDDFPEVCGASFSNLNPKHGVEHHIETTGPPVHAKYRRLDAEKYAAAEAEFLKMEKAGIIRRSNSPWSLPLHMVP